MSRADSHRPVQKSPAPASTPGCKRPATPCSSPELPPDCEREPRRQAENIGDREIARLDGDEFGRSRTTCTPEAKVKNRLLCELRGTPRRNPDHPGLVDSPAGFRLLASDRHRASEKINESRLAKDRCSTRPESSARSRACLQRRTHV